MIPFKHLAETKAIKKPRSFDHCASQDSSSVQTPRPPGRGCRSSEARVASRSRRLTRFRPNGYTAASSRDLSNRKKQMFLAEKEVQRLIEEFKVKGYRSAATYLKNAKDKMFTYVRSWLRSGIINPRVSSMIERMMREIGRRIKKIGFGWSPAGAAKMTRIIIKRITSADEWNDYWKKKLRLTGKVKISFLGCDFA